MPLKTVQRLSLKRSRLGLDLSRKKRPIRARFFRNLNFVAADQGTTRSPRDRLLRLAIGDP